MFFFRNVLVLYMIVTIILYLGIFLFIFYHPHYTLWLLYDFSWAVGYVQAINIIA